VARLFSIVMEPRAAIIAAVRITDTFLPLTLPVPVILFARAFRGRDDSGRGRVLPAERGGGQAFSGSGSQRQPSQRGHF